MGRAKKASRKFWASVKAREPGFHCNCGERGYRLNKAEAKAQARQVIRRSLKLTVPTRSKIEAKLRQMRWSPEQISGWLSAGQQVSDERINEMIWDDKRAGRQLAASFGGAENVITSVPAKCRTRPDPQQN